MLNTLFFYLLEFALFGVGALCLRTKSGYRSGVANKHRSKRKRRIVGQYLIAVATLGLVLGLVIQLFSGVPAPKTPPVTTTAPAPATLTPGLQISSAPAGPLPQSYSPTQIPPERVTLLLRQAAQLLEQKQFDPALVKVTAALQADPQNPAAYVGRGNIYTAEKLWNQAARDYRKALQLTPQAVPIQFDLAELDFMQGKYDIARPGFVVVQQNPYMSDLASYKIFLCDLLDGNEQLAGRELAAFNQVGANASYYFANAAWSLNHEKKDEAKHWLTAAARLYPPDLIKVYTASLIEIGSLDASGTPPKTTVFRLLN